MNDDDDDDNDDVYGVLYYSGPIGDQQSLKTTTTTATIPVCTINRNNELAACWWLATALLYRWRGCLSDENKHTIKTRKDNFTRPKVENSTAEERRRG
jgi:hypothetical protein